jgi:8-oxo-dGTP pyrophosphatase MutT (NUDIX family)
VVPAAVLVPLLDRPEGLSVLLTRRADHLSHHAGQISFPGGRLEPFDTSAAAAALRETEEEIGLPASHVEIIGYLDNYITITGYSVTPVVGIVRPDFDMRIDETEVAEAFEVPLEYLLDPARVRRREKKLFGIHVAYYEIPYGEYNIWGATAGMLVALRMALTGEDPGD